MSEERFKDKNGVVIKKGDSILIENSRKDISIKAIVIEGNELKMTTGGEVGKKASISTYIDAIWWREDIPANWLEVI